MHKLKPCPFCGGVPEMDEFRRYRNITTARMGNAIAVYCTSCSADMSVCYSDVPDIQPEQVADMWNKREAVDLDRRDELCLGTTTETEMRQLHVGTSPITNRIYAGHVLKDGRTWGEGKQDVTGPALGAVIEHVQASGGAAMVTVNGAPKYEILVREL